jgi:hypothetical protein
MQQFIKLVLTHSVLQKFRTEEGFASNSSGNLDLNKLSKLDAKA